MKVYKTYKTHYYKKMTKPLTEGLVKRGFARKSARKMARNIIKNQLWSERKSLTPQKREIVIPEFVNLNEGE